MITISNVVAILYIISNTYINIGTLYTYIEQKTTQTTISLPLKNSVCLIVKQNKTFLRYTFIVPLI